VSPHPVLASSASPATAGDITAHRSSISGPMSGLGLHHGLTTPPPNRRKRQSISGSATKGITASASLTSSAAGPSGVGGPTTTGTKAHEDITLDTIIHQFFKDQHRNCAKPISVVPEFSLKHRHQCPIPAVYERPLLPATAPTNASRRVFDRQIGASYSFNNSKAHWRRFKYSRYRPLRQTYGDEESALSSILFQGSNRLLVGTYDSLLIQFNVDTGEVTVRSEQLNWWEGGK